MTHASVFSGIGGPEVAAVMLGWENLFHCEINPFGRAVLDYWFPNSKSYEDITTTDFSEWRGRVNVLTGGFPCQPFSYAWQRRGAQDDRYLWPYMFRCIDQIQPDYVVAEKPRTDATGSSSSDTEMQTFLKTPCAADSWSDGMESKGVSGTSGTLAQEGVSGYAEKHSGLLLPTPLVVEREHPERVEALKATGATRINSRANGEQRPNGLIDFMQFYDMLPTPQTQGLKVCDENGKTQFMDLDMLPTPTTDIHKNAGISEEAWEKRIEDKRQEDVVMAVYKMYKDADMLDAVKDGNAFRLSPLFTEEMMGFPLGWTTLPFLSANGAPNPSKPTATPSSRK